MSESQSLPAAGLGGQGGGRGAGRQQSYQLRLARPASHLQQCVATPASYSSFGFVLIGPLVVLSCGLYRNSTACQGLAGIRNGAVPNQQSNSRSNAECIFMAAPCFDQQATAQSWSA